MSVARVLLVANRTACDTALIGAVRRRAQPGRVVFHLLVPATPQGLHRVVDPEESGREAAGERLGRALPLLGEAAGHEVTGEVGDANPLAAVADALNLRGFDEIILSTLPWRMSRWLRVDLPSKIRALGVPVLHVTSTQTAAPHIGGQQAAPSPSAPSPSAPSQSASAQTGSLHAGLAEIG